MKSRFRFTIIDLSLHLKFAPAREQCVCTRIAVSVGLCRLSLCVQFVRATRIAQQQRTMLVCTFFFLKCVCTQIRFFFKSIVRILEIFYCYLVSFASDRRTTKWYQVFRSAFNSTAKLLKCYKEILHDKLVHFIFGCFTSSSSSTS
jgi:hypothetical protein